ncbi:MAG TPA: TadE/TadG family type IV pilus assembly protein [Anaerolineaceae bacterium]
MMCKVLARIFKRISIPRLRKGQSFVELALVLPVLLLMLMGLMEVAFFIGKYLDVLDLTREAARFASVRDPFNNPLADSNCLTDGFDFYFDVSCVLAPPTCTCTKTDPWCWCNGLNRYANLNMATDDIVISIYTISGNTVTDAHPKSPKGVALAGGVGYIWAFSDNDNDTSHNSNWQKDCRGNVVRNLPHFTIPVVNSYMQQNAQPAKGYVAVELYYCHSQLLNLPFVSDIIPNPMMTHAYTIMPIPAAMPSPTPTTSP